MTKKLLLLITFLFLGIIAEAQEQRTNEYYIIPEDEVTINFNQVGDRIIFNSSVTAINIFFNNQVNNWRK